MNGAFAKLQKGLTKCRDYIFNFLENPAIPPDNNASERGIRKVKIKMKNSGTFRSDEGADAFLEILSIVETAKKHNRPIYDAIRAILSVDRINTLIGEQLQYCKNAVCKGIH
jgi:hypothetical protein